MAPVDRIIAAHPLQLKPYHCIRFSRFDGNGTPLYRVSTDKRELGAAAALKLAFERQGAHCFHCGTWMPPQKLSHACNRDHLRPRADGGSDHLHNLVITCGACNRNKGARDLVSFRVERGAAYLKALDEHLTRCLAALASVRSPKPSPPQPAPGGAAGP